jgi:ribosomal protein S14
MTKHLKYKNKILRNTLALNSYKILSIKYLLLKKNINSNLKFKIMLNLQKMHKSSFNTQINNICVNTNYSRAVMRLTQLSKNEFKKMYSEGRMTGFRKSS